MAPAARGVGFAVPAEVAFGYLVDPFHRAEWQSSLRRVESVHPRLPAVGQAWVDVTVAGLRARMETTELERPRRWSERGTWRGVEARLTLTFTAAPGGCLVRSDFAITGRGPLAPVMRLLSVLARPAVRADLRRAASLLGSRT